ncbi:MAG: undecaprenyldiphospho-muramoylpentapeptide beta-N-acetylglucosaminyltransferase [Endomicrobia bacterium]|nr:undecaprenyldiphospho-muramoylpentapeptide beta-N-acetylglucosaminyltransferase [Endomicrobiia bacterium]
MENKNLNVIIAASGTGGHIYPGISVARELKEKGYNPIFFLSSNSASAEIIKNSGFDYRSFAISGMPRRFSTAFFKFAFAMIVSFFKSVVLMLKIKPAFVIGTGGYISVPAVLAGKICFKKTFIHEQNTIPGVANRLLNVIADITFISFKESAKYFKCGKRLFYFGYPVRKDVVGVMKEDGCSKLNLDKNIFTVLIFGGSLGAAKLNETAFAAMFAASQKEKIQVLHVTGEKSFSEVKEKAAKLPFYRVFEYMHDMGSVYAAADIVICRAGAGTVFELKALNKPAVLVPYPYATDNHQYFNAQEIKKENFTEVIEEKDLTAEKLLQTVDAIRKNIPQVKPVKMEKFPQEVIAEEIIRSL